jgi:Tfp pilus assembly protein PilN
MTFVIGDESTVVGTARTRDDLLSFKRALEDSPLVEKVDLPITDLLARDNPAFTMRFTIRHATPKR